MRRRKNLLPYFALGIFLFIWISVPEAFVSRARSFTIASFTPIWKWGQRFTLPSNLEPELQRLQMENQNYQTQIEALFQWLLFDQRIGEQADLLKGLLEEEKKSSEPYWQDFFKRRSAQLKQRLTSQLISLPAQVIYRDPSSWSSSLWVNIGEEDNSTLQHVIIAKNSPVVTGTSLVGVVDYVGKKQSRVRLITDSALCPAVRAVRGSLQNRELTRQIQTLLQSLGKREDLFVVPQERQKLIDELSHLNERIGLNFEEGYLAKGELRGSGAPFWRSRSPILKGIGFNFDYADEEGPSRDLKTGPVPLLKEGDYLITSGLDGVFPPGLVVGIVTKIHALKEGAFSYELEAKPHAGNLNDLQNLFILPSLSGE